MVSHVVHVAGVRHLLDVHAGLLLGARHSSDDAVLDDVLEVREPTPDVPHILKRVGARTGVPVPGEDGDRWTGLDLLRVLDQDLDQNLNEESPT